MRKNTIFASLVLALVCTATYAADTDTKAPDPKMEKVEGIGGFFFRSNDPAAFSAWYLQHLGINITPKSKTDTPWKQTAGVTAFAPFPNGTKYFGDPSKNWMINFRVKNLDAMVAQLKSAGIAVDADPTTYPTGKFARLHDPEGNPIELWQPVE